MAKELTVRYEWGAYDSPMDLRRVGQSLLGIERILSVGLYALETGKFPVGRQRIPVSTHVVAARQGSFGVDIETIAYPGLILFYIFAHEHVSSFLMEWIMGIVNRSVNRDKEPTELTKKLLEMTEETQHHNQRMLEEQQRQQGDEIAFLRAAVSKRDELLANRDELHDRLLRIMEHDRMTSAAKDLVSPLDTEGKIISFSDNENGKHAIDKNLADSVLRRKEPSDDGIEHMTITVDGFSLHRGTLRIVHPEDPEKYISAEIVDRRFRRRPGVYLDAAITRERLPVVARVTRRNGEISKLSILELRTRRPEGTFE